MFGTIESEGIFPRKEWSEVLSIINGKDYRKIEVKTGGYPVYGSGGYMARASEFLCPANTVVVGRKGTINNPLLIKEEFWNVDTAFGLVSGPEINPVYLHWFCLQFDFTTLNKATTLPSTTKSDLLKLKMNVPPIDSQNQFEKFVEQSDKSKFIGFKSQFIEQFGTWTDSRYDVRTLEELCESIKDGTHKTPTYTDDKENGYLFLSSKDVTSKYVDWDHPMYIPAQLHEELSKRILPRKGDILLAKNGTTGIAAIVDRDCAFDIYVSLALLRFHPGQNIKFMWAAINMPETKAQFDGSLKGIGVPNLHLGEIKKTKIVVPPVELQNKFAVFLEQSDKSK